MTQLTSNSNLVTDQRLTPTQWAEMVQSGEANRLTNTSYEDVALERLEHVGKQVALGYSGVVSALPRAAAEIGTFVTGDYVSTAPLRGAANAIDQVAEVYFGGDPELRSSFWWSTVPQGFGSFGAFMSAAGIGTLVGGSTGGVVGGVVAAGASGISETSQRFQPYVEAGEISAWNASAISTIGGGTLGLLEILPVFRVLDNLAGKQAKGLVWKTFNRSLMQRLLPAIKHNTVQGASTAIQEAVTETLGEVGQNMLERTFVNKDRGLLDGIVESGGAGGVTGFVTGFLSSAYGLGKYRRIAKGMTNYETGLQILHDQAIHDHLLTNDESARLGSDVSSFWKVVTERLDDKLVVISRDADGLVKLDITKREWGSRQLDEALLHNPILIEAFRQAAADGKPLDGLIEQAPGLPGRLGKVRLALTDTAQRLLGSPHTFTQKFHKFAKIEAAQRRFIQAARLILHPEREGQSVVFDDADAELKLQQLQAKFEQQVETIIGETDEFSAAKSALYKEIRKNVPEFKKNDIKEIAGVFKAVHDMLPDLEFGSVLTEVIRRVRQKPGFTPEVLTKLEEIEKKLQGKWVVQPWNVRAAQAVSKLSAARDRAEKTIKLTNTHVVYASPKEEAAFLDDLPDEIAKPLRQRKSKSMTKDELLTWYDDAIAAVDGYVREVYKNKTLAQLDAKKFSRKKNSYFNKVVELLDNYFREADSAQVTAHLEFMVNRGVMNRTKRAPTDFELAQLELAKDSKRFAALSPAHARIEGDLRRLLAEKDLKPQDVNMIRLVLLGLNPENLESFTTIKAEAALKKSKRTAAHAIHSSAGIGLGNIDHTTKSGTVLHEIFHQIQFWMNTSWLNEWMAVWERLATKESDIGIPSDVDADPDALWTAAHEVVYNVMKATDPRLASDYEMITYYALGEEGRSKGEFEFFAEIGSIYLTGKALPTELYDLLQDARAVKGFSNLFQRIDDISHLLPDDVRALFDKAIGFDLDVGSDKDLFTLNDKYLQLRKTESLHATLREEAKDPNSPYYVGPKADIIGIYKIIDDLLKGKTELKEVLESFTEGSNQETAFMVMFMISATRLHFLNTKLDIGTEKETKGTNAKTLAKLEQKAKKEKALLNELIETHKRLYAERIERAKHTGAAPVAQKALLDWLEGGDPPTIDRDSDPIVVFEMYKALNKEIEEAAERFAAGDEEPKHTRTLKELVQMQESFKHAMVIANDQGWWGQSLDPTNTNPGVLRFNPTLTPTNLYNRPTGVKVKDGKVSIDREQLEKILDMLPASEVVFLQKRIASLIHRGKMEAWGLNYTQKMQSKGDVAQARLAIGGRRDLSTVERSRVAQLGKMFLDPVTTEQMISQIFGENHLITNILVHTFKRRHSNAAMKHKRLHIYLRGLAETLYGFDTTKPHGREKFYQVMAEKVYDGRVSRAEAIWAYALHTDPGRTAALESSGVVVKGKKYDYEQVEEMIESLTHRDRELAEGFKEFFENETFVDEAFSNHRVLQKHEAMRGPHYFPSRRDIVPTKLPKNLQEMGEIAITSTTRDLMERKVTKGKPFILDGGAVAAFIKTGEALATYSEMAIPMNRAERLMNDGDFRREFINKFGEQKWEQIVDYLRNILGFVGHNPKLMDQAMTWIPQAWLASKIMLNVTSAVRQTFSIMTAFGDDILDNDAILQALAEGAGFSSAVGERMRENSGLAFMRLEVGRWVDSHIVLGERDPNTRLARLQHRGFILQRTMDDWALRVTYRASEIMAKKQGAKGDVANALVRDLFETSLTRNQATNSPIYSTALEVYAKDHALMRGFIALQRELNRLYNTVRRHVVKAAQDPTQENIDKAFNALFYSGVMNTVVSVGLNAVRAAAFGLPVWTAEEWFRNVLSDLVGRWYGVSDVAAVAMDTFAGRGGSSSAKKLHGPLQSVVFSALQSAGAINEAVSANKLTVEEAAKYRSTGVHPREQAIAADIERALNEGISSLSATLGLPFWAVWMQGRGLATWKREHYRAMIHFEHAYKQTEPDTLERARLDVVRNRITALTKAREGGALTKEELGKRVFRLIQEEGLISEPGLGRQED
jgi:hypothetical protein